MTPETTKPASSEVLVSHGPDERTMGLLFAIAGIDSDMISRTVSPQNATEGNLQKMSSFDLLEAAKAQNAIIERLQIAIGNYRLQAAANDPYFNPKFQRLAYDALLTETEVMRRIDEALRSRAK
jgi:hypothetical protein